MSRLTKDETETLTTLSRRLVTIAKLLRIERRKLCVQGEFPPSYTIAYVSNSLKSVQKRVNKLYRDMSQREEESLIGGS
jgi:hypothetical protein